jgi:hypothetical protein
MAIHLEKFEEKKMVELMLNDLKLDLRSKKIIWHHYPIHLFERVAITLLHLALFMFHDKTCNYLFTCLMSEHG